MIWQKGSDHSRLPLASFAKWASYDTGTERKSRQWRKDWYCLETFLEKYKAKESEMMTCLREVTPSAPASRAFPSLPPTLPPLRQQDQPLLSQPLLSPLNTKTTRMKTSMMTHLHLTSSKSSSCHTVDKLTCGMCVCAVV